MNSQPILRAVLATSLMFGSGSALAAKQTAAAFKASCAPVAPSAKALSATALLEQGMKGKEFPTNEAHSLRNFSRLLTGEYGLSKPLEAITDPEASKAIGRISLLISNNYVIAAQMALGVATVSKALPKEVADRAGDMIFTATDPTDHDKDLMALQKQFTEADAAFAGSNPRVRAFARWVLKGYAFNDPIAIDAAVTGYCQSSPSAADNANLEKWVAATRLPQDIIEKTKPNARRGPQPL